jgi:NADH-quinone oxidoreductase subunit M
MGGLKIVAPNLAILLLIVVLGSIALPLTAGFVGEFLMIVGLYEKSVWYAVFGGLTLILGAIYMLYAYQRIMLGDKNNAFGKITDLRSIDYIIMIPLIAIILVLGVYPQPVFDLLGSTIDSMKNLIEPAVSAVSIVTK